MEVAPGSGGDRSERHHAYRREREADECAGPKDSGWYTTVTGITGDALALPRGDMDPFGIPAQPTGPGGGNPRSHEPAGHDNADPNAEPAAVESARPGSADELELCREHQDSAVSRSSS